MEMCRSWVGMAARCSKRQQVVCCDFEAQCVVGMCTAPMLVLIDGENFLLGCTRRALVVEERMEDTSSSALCAGVRRYVVTAGNAKLG